MKLLLNFFSSFSFSLLFPAIAFAHETEVAHEEPVPTISPVLLVGLVVLLGIGGFLLWKFVLHTPKSSSPTQSVLPDKSPPAQEKTVSQDNQRDNSQKNI